jgi:glycosyltransferase involved in cell wall biosynthesis
MIAKDAEATIGKTLSSLDMFSEVIVYINNSTDNTLDICKSYKNVTVIEGEFIGFGTTKNMATTYSTNDWIFSLDSDEVLSEEFVSNIKDIELDSSSVYQIVRSNYYKDKEVNHCWGNDTIVRLYNRKSTSFTDSKVHEKIICKDMQILPIDGVVRHFPYNSISDFIIKLDRYSSLFANDNIGKKTSSPTKAFFNAMYSFIRSYLIKRGFLDGYAGLLASVSHAVNNFYKYMKLYEVNLELHKRSNHE